MPKPNRKTGFQPIGDVSVVNLAEGEHLPEHLWDSSGIPYTVAIQQVAILWANLIAGISGVTGKPYTEEQMEASNGVALGLTMVEQQLHLPSVYIKNLAVGIVFKRLADMDIDRAAATEQIIAAMEQIGAPHEDRS